MFRGQLSHTGGSQTIVTSGLLQYWEFEPMGCVFSSPAVVNDRVYFGSGGSCTNSMGNVYCLSVSTGQIIWQFHLGGSGTAVVSSPAVAGEYLYVGSENGNLYCLNANTGEEIWNNNTGDMIISSPAVANGRVYVGSVAGNLRCLDAETGAFIWVKSLGGEVSSSPAVVAGRVYVGSCDHKIYCLNGTTGTELWNYTTGNMVLSSPAVSEERVYVGSEDGNLYCLDALTGARLWNYTTGARSSPLTNFESDHYSSSPAVIGGQIFVGTRDGYLYCLDTDAGNLNWKYTAGREIESSPAVAGGFVYVGVDMVGLLCLEADTGNPSWLYAFSFADSSPAVAGGRVYFGSYDKFYCLPMILTSKAFINMGDWIQLAIIVGGIAAVILSTGIILARRPPRKEPHVSEVSKLPDRDAPHRGRTILLGILLLGPSIIFSFGSGIAFRSSYGLMITILLWGGLIALYIFIRRRFRNRVQPPLDLSRLAPKLNLPLWKRELNSFLFLGIFVGGYAVFVFITDSLDFIIWDLPTITLSIICALTVTIYYFTRWGFLEEKTFRKIARVGVHNFPPQTTPSNVNMEHLSTAYGIPFSRPEFVNQPPRWQRQAGIYYKWYQKYQLRKLAPVIFFGIFYFIFKAIPFVFASLGEDLLAFLFYSSIALTALVGVIIYVAIRGRARNYVRAIEVNALFENLLNDLLMRARSKRVVNIEEVCRDHGFTYTTFLQKIPDVKYSPFYEVGDLDLPTGRFILKSQYANPLKLDERVAKDLQQEISSSGQINLTQFCRDHALDFGTFQNLLYQYIGKNQFKGHAGITQTGDYLINFEQGVDPQAITNLDQFLQAAFEAESTGAGKKKGGKI